MMSKRLFCEISPFTYKISVAKCCMVRHIKNALGGIRFAHECRQMPLSNVVYRHNSLIRRKLGDIDSRLQDNKAVNLGIAAPKVTGVLIRPGETFSFWHLVGNCSARKGYLTGLTISNGATNSGIGGGMCQFTNLIHWMVLHSPLTIVEHHHHDRFDLFPDNGRQVPFGSGTSIMYNYLDYRFRNDTDVTFQIVTYTDDTYLHGELRSDKPLKLRYHIKCENEVFVQEADGVYRNNEIWRNTIDSVTGELVERTMIKKNHAKVMYKID